MRAKITKNSDDGSYNLYVNGQCKIHRESFQVVDFVMSRLRGASSGGYEVDEVADKIIQDELTCPECNTRFYPE
ncbi:MAG TPA: hypothetical protein VLS27_06450 [Gammaproteobacteria bacterium]|nr:hypothetical protein [Gammaproteobacteria bacterium]